jgi:hypothetical protein
MSDKKTSDKKASKSEARRRKGEVLVEQIASAVGRLTLGERAVSPSTDLGLELLDVYGRVTGDSILSAFARGALEGRKTEQSPQSQKDAPSSAPVPAQKKNDPDGYATMFGTSGKTYSLDDYRATRRAESEKKSEPNHHEAKR